MSTNLGYWKCAGKYCMSPEGCECRMDPKPTVEDVMARMDVTPAEAQNVVNFLNGLLDPSGGLEGRPCGKESGPCCGGRCG